MDGLKEKERREIGLESLALGVGTEHRLSVLHGCHSLPAFQKAFCPSHVTTFYM